MLVKSVARCCCIALLVASPLFAADDYKLGPDSQVQAGVPQGKVAQGKWVSEKVFPGTERDYRSIFPRSTTGQNPPA